MKFRSIGFIVLLCSALARAVPTPAELSESVSKAAGGKEKLEAIKSMTMLAQLTIPAQNLAGTVEFYRKPGKFLMLTSLAGIMDAQAGLNDGVAYEKTTLAGVRLLSDEETQQMLAGVEGVDQVDRLAKLADAKVTGPEKIGDADTWKLTGKNDRGTEETYWIDTQTSRILQAKTIAVHQMGQIEAVVNFEDYKTTDGIEVPMTMRTRAAGMEMVLKIAKLQMNPEIDDARFALPDDVKKLAAKKKPATSPTTKPVDAPKDGQ